MVRTAMNTATVHMGQSAPISAECRAAVTVMSLSLIEAVA